MPQVDRIAGRRHGLLLAAVLALSLVLAGCGGQPTASPSPSPEVTPPPAPTVTPGPGSSPDGVSPGPTEPVEPTPPGAQTPSLEPSPTVSVESAAHAAALVLASDQLFLGTSAPQLELVGQCCWYQAHEAVGHFLVTVEVGWGDCLAGCIWTHRWLHRVDTDGTVTLLEQEGDEPVERDLPPATGSGTATIVALAGPICPVEPFPPDPNCAPRPVEGARMTVHDPGGLEVQQAVTDADGRLVLELPAGAYYVVPGDAEGLMGTPQPQAFSIGGGDRVPVRFDYDTGIR